MKYMLAECIEREINTPEILDTWEEAFDLMCQRVADVLHISKEEAKERYFEGCDDEIGITESNAWISDYYHNNYDWKIYDVHFSGTGATCVDHFHMNYNKEE